MAVASFSKRPFFFIGRSLSKTAPEIPMRASLAKSEKGGDWGGIRRVILPNIRQPRAVYRHFRGEWRGCCAAYNKMTGYKGGETPAHITPMIYFETTQKLRY